MIQPPPVVRRRRLSPVVWLFGVVAAGMGLGLWTLAMRAGSGSVRRVAHADPALQAASRRARSELDSFIARLRNPRPGERFAIRGAFATPMGPEYLWVKDPRYAGGTFTGILDQPPFGYRAARRGDVVKVPRDDVFDWMIRADGQTIGGYTEQVLSQERSGARNGQ